MDVKTVRQGDLRGDDVEHQQQHDGAVDQTDEGAECVLSEDEPGQLSDVRLQERSRGVCEDTARGSQGAH